MMSSVRLPEVVVILGESEDSRMKVFLSWSGEMSHKVADAFREWLPYVIQSLKPFVSSGDINKGARWNDVLAQELKDAKYGIICITHYNTSAPWLNFEAGALSNIVGPSSVAPFLFNVDRSVLRGPLTQFESTVYEKNDIYNLLVSINNRLKPKKRLDQQLLSQEFGKWWENLKCKLDAIPDMPEVEAETGYSWLLPLEELIKREVREDVKEICIITPNIIEQSIGDNIRAIVEKNIEHKVAYKYIVPQSKLTDEIKKELKNISSDPNTLAVKGIPDNEFHRQAVTDYIIINPDQDDNHTRRAYLQLPVKPPGYWILVNEEAAIGFKERFRSMWKRNRGGKK